MTVRNLSDRLSRLEKAKQPERDTRRSDAFERIYYSLQEGMLAREDSTSDIITLLKELDTRIKSDTLTEEDRRVLSNVPAEDLVTYGYTAEHLIDVLVRVEEMF